MRSYRCPDDRSPGWIEQLTRDNLVDHEIRRITSGIR